MNEKIKQLAEQAYEQQPLMIANSETFEIEHKIGNSGVPMYHKVFNQEKFAELIIKECAEHISNDVRMSMITAENVAHDLKMYFGVE